MFKKLFLVLFVSFIYAESALANFDVKARTCNPSRLLLR
jgi:hypothetical protein